MNTQDSHSEFSQANLPNYFNNIVEMQSTEPHDPLMAGFVSSDKAERANTELIEVVNRSKNELQGYNSTKVLWQRGNPPSQTVTENTSSLKPLVSLTFDFGRGKAHQMGHGLQPQIGFMGQSHPQKKEPLSDENKWISWWCLKFTSSKQNPVSSIKKLFVGKNLNTAG